MSSFSAPAPLAFALYDSAAQAVLPLTLPKGQPLSFYACGITPYAAPHVGHLRSFVAFDAMARVLEAFGWPTTLVRNITDIDDKILAMAAEQGTDWQTLSGDWAAHNRTQFARVGVRPTPEPRVSTHIPQILALIERLIALGHAYATPTGDVYFSLATFTTGTDVAHQPREALRSAAGLSRVGTEGKREPADFALWKAAKPGEPAWTSPWGAGRPGWHIECSAMAEAFFGDTLTIHGGGTDLRFPHHQCEVCQSEAAFGRPLARHWIHHGSVLHAGEKMSKSLGNTVTAAEALTEAEALAPGQGGAVVRWALLGAHWPKPLDWKGTLLPRAAADLARLADALHAAMRTRGVRDWAGLQGHAEGANAPPFVGETAFWAALGANFNVPLAQASVRQAAKAARTAGPVGWAAAHFLAQAVRLLGLDEAIWPTAWQAPVATPLSVPQSVQRLVVQREGARAARDFAQADVLRAQILARGWQVADRPEGPHLQPAG
jgi:cysteinyl-tRNA synthetase